MDLKNINTSNTMNSTPKIIENKPKKEKKKKKKKIDVLIQIAIKN